MKVKHLKYVLGLFVLAISLSGVNTAFAASFYAVKVVKVLPRAQNNGDVVIQVDPDSTETRFTETSRVIIDGTSPGASKLMTVFTAALLLNKTVTVLVDNPPSFASPQIVQSAGLTAN